MQRNPNEQAHYKKSSPPEAKNKSNNIKVLNENIPVVTLKRTDTTLDLSQKAKRFKEKKKK